VRLGLVAAKPTDAVTYGLLPAAARLGLEVFLLTDEPDGHAGALARARLALRWYPPDVWLYLLAAQWRRVAQEEAAVESLAERLNDVRDQLTQLSSIHATAVAWRERHARTRFLDTLRAWSSAP